MTTSLDVRNGLVDLLRRDLLGPHPDRDGDLAKEVLDQKPSRWYVSGFIVPAYDGAAPPKTDEEEVAEQQEDDLLASETLDRLGDGRGRREGQPRPAPARSFPALVNRPHRRAARGREGGRAQGDLGRLQDGPTVARCTRDSRRP